MAPHERIGDVDTWFETQGSGPPLVLLHPGGAGVDARALTRNVPAFAEHFTVFTPERRAHGRTPDVEGPITFEAMANDTIGFVEKVVGGPAALVGSSDGAIVALFVALARPDLVTRLVLAGGVFHHRGWHPSVLDPAAEPPSFLRDLYGQISPDGADHYDIVVHKLKTMHAKEPTFGPDDLRKVACRTLVMIGDDDEVSLEHAIELYRALPNGELAVVPGTSHGLLVEKPALCHAIMLDFLQNDPVTTFAPIRRKAKA